MSPPAEPSPLALDACGVLNLAAAIPLDTVSDELGRRLYVVSQAASEVLYLDDDEEGVPVRTRVELSGVVVVELEPAELPAYVALAIDLDDGEAATLAAAQVRGWPVCTDDRKAARVAAGMHPPVGVRSTATILRSWASRRQLSESEVGAVLRRVEVRANFTAPSTDPDVDSWQRCVGLADDSA